MYIFVFCLQQEEHPKKTVAFQVDQEQKLKDDEVRIAQQSEKESVEKIESISAEAKMKLEQKTEEVSSEVIVEVEKRITKQV